VSNIVVQSFFPLDVILAPRHDKLMDMLFEFDASPRKDSQE